MRQACGALQDSRSRDESVNNDLGGIRHAWSATRAQTARCWLCVQDQLSTRSASLFFSRRSARWLCILPHVRHPFGPTRSCLVQLQEKEWGHGVFASWSSPSTVPAKDSDAPLAQGDAASCAFFPLWHDGLRHGQGTSLLFHDASPVSFPLKLRQVCQVHLH